MSGAEPAARGSRESRRSQPANDQVGDRRRGGPERRLPAALRGRSGWRSLAGRAGGRVSRMSYIVRWLVLGAVIGAIAGLGAVVFYEALRLSTEFFLRILANYRVPTPAGEGDSPGSASYLRAWAIPLVVVAGGLIAGFLIFTWAPEAEGHGTDAAIDAVHHNPRGIRLRAVVVKIVASAITIGSGGSGGREGPTAQISAGFGSLLARVLDLSPEDGRIAVSVGIGAGIGAIFSAPLGGAVLAADIVYREDFEYEALLPGLFASIIAYAIFGAVYGYHSLFATPSYRFDQPVQLVWFAVIGLVAGGIGLLYSKGFYGVVSLSRCLPFSRKLRPAVGGLLVGLVALELPEVLGTGYGWVQESLSNELLHTPLWIVLLLPVARIAATAFSIGTGGSGGVFGPGMVIGAFTGLAVWRLFEPFAPGVGHDPAPYVVVGMMAVFGGISRAPLAVMVMVAEMTGNLQIVAPAMVAVALSALICARADDSIYRSQLRTRADSRASRLQFGLPLLSFVGVADASRPPKVVLRDDAPLAVALEELRDAGVPGAPVVDEGGHYVGTVDADRAARLLSPTGGGLGAGAGAAGNRDSGEGGEGAGGSAGGALAQRTVAAALDPTSATVPDTARLDVALDALVQAGASWVTVTSANRVVGILSVGDMMREYRRVLRESAGQVASVSTGAVTIEARVGADSPLAGVPLGAAGLPPGCIVVSVQRGEHMIFATGSTTLQHGDLVSALASPTTAEAVRRMIRGTDQPKPPMVERGPQMV